MIKQKQAFTLVELIVVITILAVLGTIAFISLQGYSRDARDSVRLSDIKNIERALELEVTQNGKVPKPSNALTLESNGIIIGYQGEMGEKEMGQIGVVGGGKDPVDQTYYTYRTNDKLTTYQLMGFLESTSLTFDSNILQINAVDLTKRLPVIRGNTLGILLEQNTNNPLQNIETGTIELSSYSRAVDMYLTPAVIKSATGTKNLYGTMEVLSKYQSFDIPNKPCPKGFIPVPGNKDFGQPAFCVAKYEMSYAGLTQTDNSGDWNTYSYIDNASTRPALGKIVSAQGNSPIAEIKQPQAIEECNAMGDGYHLITNNEWMTIARNIELQGGNWSTGNIGGGYIHNGISNSINLGCSINGLAKPTSNKKGTVTGDDICGGKNKLILSNGEEIWDLSGNVWEHVNKTNDINSSNGANGTETDFTTITTWVEWTNTGIDNMERSEYGPSIPTYNSTNGMGRIHDNPRANNLFVRGGAINYVDSGIFTLFLNYSINSQFRGTGFRCAKY